MVGYFAHSGQREDHSDWQLLKDHLLGVAGLAKRFAEEARPGDAEFAQAAYTAGLLHDLGKYRPEFQEYIRDKRVKSESTRHKQVGAARALASRRIDLATAIMGHHAGMLNTADMASSAAEVSEVLAQVLAIAQADCPECGLAISPGIRGVASLSLEMQSRLLFSCLVDADWLDTSDHEAKTKQWSMYVRPPALDAATLLTRVREYIAGRAAKCKDAKIAAIREQVLDVSLSAAEQVPGVFSMAVPTGGGKTLSSLAFALKHAQRHGLQRVIYVAPYLSIIEQNARVFREALQDDSGGLILEHHSLAEAMGKAGGTDEAQTDSAQRLAENWDMPVVLTTSVQFYETLFSNNPGRSRKLHNIARSVVILDECQTLPPGLIAPTCQMLQQAAEYLGCSIVLCTATQPAWNRDASLLPEGLEGVREIVPAQLDLFSKLKRVVVTWPSPTAPTLDWSDVAGQMLDRQQALCVVNTKKAAREVFGHLRRAGGEGVFHLSTAMCPAHRLQTLDEVRRLLADGKPCHLVSTQLIEAGVDVDFPLLMREMAPLEAVVQAAGRCNREGLLERGKVIVFRSVEGKLPRDAWYCNGVRVLDQDFIRAGHEPDIHAPADLSEYFRRLYRTGELDQRNICTLRRGLSFRDVAKEYRLMDDATTSLVVTAWEEKRAEVERLLDDIRTRPTRRLYRDLQRYCVNVYEYDLRRLGGSVVLDHLPGVNLCALPYDQALGLVPGEGSGAMLC